MLKQFLLALILSIGVAYFSINLAALLHVLTDLQYELIHLVLKVLPFEINKSSLLIGKTIALTIFPFILVLIPAFFYWLTKRKEMPNLSSIIWIAWVISSLIFVLQK
jgi:hypothetical protein